MIEKYYYDEKYIYSLYMKMEEKLSHHRYIHSVGVAGTAVSLAMKYGSDVSKAQIAGILHDCAKCYSDAELIKLCRKHDIDITGFEEQNGFLLHAKYGSYMAEHKYGICDVDILNAIKWHTTGRENMSLLEKIVFVSDYIEPTREKADNLAAIRDKAYNSDSIDEALIMIMHDTINYLTSNDNSIDITTMNAYEYYKNMLKSK